jgi:hypothetical protein
LSSTLSLGRKSSVRIAHSPSQIHRPMRPVCSIRKPTDPLKPLVQSPRGRRMRAQVNRTATSIIYPLAALCFSELRAGDAARCYHIASCTCTVAINQTFPGIYCLVRRRFD